MLHRIVWVDFYVIFDIFSHLFSLEQQYSSWYLGRQHLIATIFTRWMEISPRSEHPKGVCVCVCLYIFISRFLFRLRQNSTHSKGAQDKGTAPGGGPTRQTRRQRHRLHKTAARRLPIRLRHKPKHHQKHRVPELVLIQIQIHRLRKRIEMVRT